MPVSEQLIRVDASSYVDPQGFLFHYEDRIFRCIRPQAESLFRRLESEGHLERWADSFGLVPYASVPAPATDPRLKDAWVVEHPRIWPLTYCNEWSTSMLREAGELTLNLAIELADHNLMLQDAYPWNVLFSGTRPIFVDLTSIAEPSKESLWPAQEQFDAFFVRPLVLAQEGKAKVSRALLQNHVEGISLETFMTLVSLRYKWRHPLLSLALFLDAKLQKSTSMKNKIRESAARVASNADASVRKLYLKRQLARLPKGASPKGLDPWTDYYAEINPAFDKQAKVDRVRDLLARSAPRTVIDIGCNTGVFSILAAESGASVVSVDSSEHCVDKLFHVARARNLAITPLISDVVASTPSYGFLGSQFPSLWERTRSDTALFLGIMHHIHVAGRQSFANIAALLATCASKSLIFEYVGMDDANMAHLPQSRNINYSLESVSEALRVHFPKIEVFDSDRSSRKLMLCTR